MDNKRISKFLSLVLRHKPEALGITLDRAGWTSVDELLMKMQQQGMPVDLPKLQEVVATNDKQRFAFNADSTLIRASQGHSIAVELGLQPLAPPPVLYHGTATQHIASILKEGLQAGSRQYVHLSADITTARTVGQRHGQPVILQVNTASMHTSGHTFYQAANGVWLTASVPPLFLEIISQNR
ncbi:RNA 2'-phosphotransferase [Cesiribacter sp. SM1]|uniref:RNA 2'-phosphotransferase n=1 Tax=Cesiribacter sp. SM1 TaxID=2861196 RepID=UPI001CD4BA0D|nr:RNA 2'-phosphotransferase [Cesiribacter sp. SM1]